jgi:C4-dicarboxylate transporter DctQ subunit
VRLLKRPSNFFDRILEALTFFAGVILLFMMLSVGAAVVARYFFGQPMGWVVEISEYIILYITFLVAAWILREDGHVKMDFVLGRLSMKNRSLLDAVTSAICLAICLILTWFAAKVAIYQYQTGYFTVTLLELPKFIFTGIISLGSLLLSLQFLRKTQGHIKSWKVAAKDKD